MLHFKKRKGYNIMANIKSAKKRTQQINKKRVQNGMRRSMVRTLEKKVRLAIAEKRTEDALSNYRVFCSLIDKAAKTNIIHPNKSSRKKSRLAAFIKAKSTA